MDIDENMKIRKHLNNLNFLYNQVYEANFTNSKMSKEFILDTLYINSLTDRLDYILQRIMASMHLKDEEFRMNKLKSFLTNIILIQDAYMTLTFEQITGKLTKEHEKLLKMIITAIEKEDFNILISNIKYILELVNNSLYILNAPALDKVALISSLDEDDISKLSKLNPFFKQEYDHYNIDITEEFILKHLRIWIDKSGEKAAFERISQFFINMNYADDYKIDDFFNVLLNYTDEETLVNLISDEDLEGISKILKEFYEDRKEKELKK